jgi:NitT/TauT family transport system permease protein
MAEAARPAITIGDDAPPVMLQHKRVLGVSVATWPKILMPLAVGILALAGWELAVRLQGIPVYILPGPILIAKTMVSDWGTLSGSLWITLSISLAALSAAVVLGVSLSVLFAQSKWVEISFFPYAVILQVTLIPANAGATFVVTRSSRESVFARYFI